MDLNADDPAVMSRVVQLFVPRMANEGVTLVPFAPQDFPAGMMGGCGIYLRFGR